MNGDNLKEVEHHKQLQLCKTRPAYRRGRNLTAVKVYTINSESQHLFVYGVPKIKLRSELKSVCLKYGQVLRIQVVLDHKTEIFTECYHVRYERIQSARIAKRLLDNKSFYGGILHVCYAPEYESIEETRIKLVQRNRDVLSRLSGNESEHTASVPHYFSNKYQVNRKRKNPAIALSDNRLADLDPATVWHGIPTDIDPREPKKTCPKPSEPVKHYQMRRSPGVPYGPDITDYRPDCNREEKKCTDEPKVLLNLIPTQVKKNVVKQIVFRNKNKVNS